MKKYYFVMFTYSSIPAVARLVKEKRHLYGPFTDGEIHVLKRDYPYLKELKVVTLDG